ncbi:hypothetical protein BDV40DRAFT_267216 [Aspergillus tamarii]|uniref:Uncharacterized protein n=1 Tax=Aspergillus tamarii TaxID=41984 RepID=A0A5N6USK8_ASPTM|nr:hypothetical protein BDV40DRAFT_267216 [Aspergillus tamarii]
MSWPSAKSQGFSGLSTSWALGCYVTRQPGGGTNWYWVSLRVSVYLDGCVGCHLVLRVAYLMIASLTSVVGIWEVESWGYRVCYNGLLCVL